MPNHSDIDLRHCEPPLGGAAIQGGRSGVRAGPLDCFVASLLAMTGLARSNRVSGARAAGRIRRLRDRRGIAAAEAALAVGLVLIPLTLGVIDYGLLVADEARLDRAMQAATFYVWNNLTSFTASGIQSAATAGFGSASPTLTVSSSTACVCVSSGYVKGAAVSCTGTCPTGQQVGAYLTITTSARFTLPVSVPYLHSPVTRSLSGTIRTQ
jgi:Flp pilus assembly protein TadG